MNSTLPKMGFFYTAVLAEDMVPFADQNSGNGVGKHLFPDIVKPEYRFYFLFIRLYFDQLS